MSAHTPAEQARLRAELELKSGLVRALQGELEQQRERAGTQAALLADVTAEIRRMLEEIHRGRGQAGAPMSPQAGDALGLCSDLADLCAARRGSLVLAPRPVNLRQLISRVLAPRGASARIAADVPSRVVADERLLERMLGNLIDGGLAGTRTVEVKLDDPVAGTDTDGALEFRLCTDGSAPPREADLSPAVRLRAAFMDEVARYLGGRVAGEALFLPLPSSADPAATGLHRLRLEGSTLAQPAMNAPAGERSGVSAPPGRMQADAPIDLVYLDQQLGSLAPIVLKQAAPLFLAQAQARMAAMHVAYQTGQSERLRALSRCWRNSALSIGARPLASLLEAAERQLGTGHMPPESVLWQVRLALDHVERGLVALGVDAGARA